MSAWRVVSASARPRAWALAAGGARRWQGMAGLGLLCLAVLMGLTGQGLVAGFAMLGALLLGAALMLGPLLDAVLTGAARVGAGKGPVRDWFWADTRQQLPGLTLALMALLRQKLDEAGAADGKKYELSIASPASSWILASRTALRFSVGARVTQFPSGSMPTTSEWAC